MMTRRRVAHVISLLAVALSATSASPTSAAPPPGDSATIAQDSALYEVSGGLVFFAGSATLDARSNADGSGPTGTWQVHFGGGSGPTYSGDVTCLTVRANEATVGLEGTVFPGPSGETLPFAGFMTLVDGGPPVPVPPFPVPPVELFNPPDTVEFVEFATPVGPTDCMAAAGLPTPSVIRTLSNDVTVVDTVSKDQCKHGGWRALGFRNQGQCVAHTVHGPKP
jgi:hypothetical protein